MSKYGFDFYHPHTNPNGVLYNQIMSPGAKIVGRWLGEPNISLVNDIEIAIMEDNSNSETIAPCYRFFIGFLRKKGAFVNVAFAFSEKTTKNRNFYTSNKAGKITHNQARL